MIRKTEKVRFAMLVMPSKVVLLACAWTITLPNLLFAQDAYENPVETQIRNGLAPYAEIGSLSVSYKARRGEDAPLNQSPAVVHISIDVCRPFYFRHESAHETNHVPAHEDPFRQIALFNSESVVVIHPFHNEFSELPFDSSRRVNGTLSTEFIMVTTGLCPVTDRPSPSRSESSHAYSLGEIAQSPSLVVDGDARIIHGLSCIKLSHDHEVLYVFLDDGLRVIQRDSYDSDSGELVATSVFNEHFQLSPGIWCPRTIFYKRFLNSKQISSSVCDVLSASTNQQPPELYRFVPSPGAIRLDGIGTTSPKQIVPGGTEYLAELVAWIQKYRLNRKQDAISDSKEVVIYGTAMLVIACLLIVFRKSLFSLSRQRFNHANLIDHQD